jgi:hypothetical protein
LARTCRWAQHGQRWPVACWPREQEGRRRLLRRRRHYDGRGDRKRGVGGAANDGEGGGALGRFGEGSEVEEQQRRRSFAARQWRPWPQLGAERPSKREAAARVRGRSVEALALVMEEQGASRRVALRWDAHQQWMACSAAWATRRPAVEHLACVGEGDVGSRFGPLPDRIRPWAKNEV